MERLLTMDEAATALGLPLQTLRFWRHQGTGPASFKLGPRRVVYAEADLIAWVDEQRARSRSTAV